MCDRYIPFATVRHVQIYYLPIILIIIVIWLFACLHIVVVILTLPLLSVFHCYTLLCFGCRHTVYSIYLSFFHSGISFFRFFFQFGSPCAEQSAYACIIQYVPNKIKQQYNRLTISWCVVYEKMKHILASSYQFRHCKRNCENSLCLILSMNGCVFNLQLRQTHDTKIFIKSFQTHCIYILF